MSDLHAKEYFESRRPQRLAFLSKHIPASFNKIILGADWASRRYIRIKIKGKSYMFMEALPDHIMSATMGHRVSSFVKVDKLLRKKGIHVPEIIALDEKEGFLLLEDFGDTTLHTAMQTATNQHDLYAAATDVLIDMRDKISLSDLHDFPKYKDSHIRKGMQRLVDWYVPATRREQNGDDLLASYLSAWEEVTAKLPPPPVGFIHGDFHPQNLMLLADGTCGVLDFQDAMAGPLPYDLANLLENIRVDVPRDIYDAMMTRYGGDENFKVWFRIMATQFHCRIIGQVIRLAVLSDRTELLGYIPRVQNYLIEGLKDPVMAPLAAWMKREKVDLAANDVFAPEKTKQFIRADAF